MTTLEKLQSQWKRLVKMVHHEEKTLGARFIVFKTFCGDCDKLTIHAITDDGDIMCSLCGKKTEFIEITE